VACDGDAVGQAIARVLRPSPIDGEQAQSFIGVIGITHPW